MSDRIYAKADNDTIDANNFRSDGDLGDGGSGRDTILLNDGDGADRARGAAAQTSATSIRVTPRGAAIAA